MSSLGQCVGSRGALDVYPWPVMLALLWKWVSGFSGPCAQCKCLFSCPEKGNPEKGVVFQKGQGGERKDKAK